MARARAMVKVWTRVTSSIKPDVGLLLVFGLWLTLSLGLG
jgi:hypothetical protein